jgi:hypothetical protein
MREKHKPNNKKDTPNRRNGQAENPKKVKFGTNVSLPFLEKIRREI